MRQSLCKAVVVGMVLAGALMARADFTLYGTDQMTVNTDLSSSVGYLYDQSRVDIVSGGSVDSLNACNSSTATVSGGNVIYVNAYDSSTTTISDGSVACIYAYDSSTTTISGGWVNYLYAYGSSTVYSGYVDDVYAYDSSTVSGGSVGYLYACNSGTATISSGNVNYLNAYDSSTVTVSGGGVSDLYASGSSTVTFNATDFIYGSGLTLDGSRVLGTGVLSGKWFDGTSWSVSIDYHDPTATILAVPEPMTLSMLMMGGLGMLRRRK